MRSVFAGEGTIAVPVMSQTWAEWAPELAPVITPRVRSNSAIHRAADADEPGPRVDKARSPR